MRWIKLVQPVAGNKSTIFLTVKNQFISETFFVRQAHADRWVYIMHRLEVAPGAIVNLKNFTLATKTEHDNLSERIQRRFRPIYNDYCQKDQCAAVRQSSKDLDDP
jgi:hypothetical protein